MNDSTLQQEFKMKKINFHAIATIIQKDLRKKGGFHNQVIECGSPTVIVEFDVNAANDEDNED
jgi:hypothetical protein